MSKKILITGASGGFGKLTTLTLLKNGHTVVDKMGMGSPFQGYNEQLEQITSGIYGAFGMGDMLKLKV